MLEATRKDSFPGTLGRGGPCQQPDIGSLSFTTVSDCVSVAPSCSVRGTFLCRARKLMECLSTYIQSLCKVPDTNSIFNFQNAWLFSNYERAVHQIEADTLKVQANQSLHKELDHWVNWVCEGPPAWKGGSRSHWERWHAPTYSKSLCESPVGTLMHMSEYVKIPHGLLACMICSILLLWQVYSSNMKDKKKSVQRYDLINPSGCKRSEMTEFNYASPWLCRWADGI